MSVVDEMDLEDRRDILLKKCKTYSRYICFAFGYISLQSCFALIGYMLTWGGEHEIYKTALGTVWAVYLLVSGSFVNIFSLEWVQSIRILKP